MVAEEAERDLLRVAAEFPGIVGAIQPDRVRHTEEWRTADLAST